MKNYAYYDVAEITSIKDMIEKSVEKYGSKTAFLRKPERGRAYESVSYIDFSRDVESLGTSFLDLDLKRVAVISENRYEWAISYLAAVNGKSMVIPIDKELPFEDWSNLLKISKADAVVYSKKFSEDMIKAKESIEGLNFLINMDIDDDTENELSLKKLLKNGKNDILNGDSRFKNIEIDTEEARILLFTSGTTALSKGVLHSHKTISSNLMNMCRMLYIDDKDVFLSVLPIHHTYECTCGFLCPLYRGATVAYCEGLKYIQKNLAESKATIMLGVPAIFEAMYKRIWAAAKKNNIDKKLKKALSLSNTLRKAHIDLRKKLFKQVTDNFGGNIRMFIAGAAAVNPEVSKGFRDLGINFFQGYGITECAPIVALNRDYFYKDDSAGYPCVGMDVKIIDCDENGIGEIICRGPNVMLGYYEDQKATDEVLKNNWFYTGDLAYFDDDGFIHITGRKKNVIIASNGKNVFPEELETFLNDNPFIAESMVYGGKANNETVLCAIIVPNYDYIKSTNPNATDEDVKNMIEGAVKALNKRNPLYKYIRKFEIRDTELAKTTTKKIKRYVEKPNN